MKEIDGSDIEVMGARGDAGGVDHDSQGAQQGKLNFGRANRVPTVLQTEAAECGLACIAMVAGYYGHHADLATLRQKFSLSLKGTSLRRVMEIAHDLGLQCRPVRIEMDELRDLKLPCILHWDLDHFVVLKRVNKKSLEISDPAVGARTISLFEAGKHFTGVALEAEKGATFNPKQPKPPPPLKSLAGPVQGLSKSLAHIFGLALVLELFALLTPLSVQIVVDQVLAGADTDLLTLVGVGFLILLALQVLVSGLRTWTVMWLSSHFNLAWSSNVFRHLMKLPQTYYMTRHLGDVVSRFGAVSIIQQTLTTRFVAVILDGIMAVLTLGMMMLYSVKLALVSLLAFAIYAGLRTLYFKVLRGANYTQITDAAKQQTCFLESVRGTQTIRLNNQEAAQSAKYLNASVDTLNSSIGIQRLDLWFKSSNTLLFGAQRIIVLWIGAWLALRGMFSAGMLMAFLAYVDQFAARGANLIDYLVDLRLLRLQGERLTDIVHSRPERNSESDYAGSAPEPSVVFRNVGFQYAKGEPWIIKDCSFEIGSGQTVAIVGPSGAGKSTIVRLLAGLVDPGEGSIEVGGMDIRRLGKRSFRAMCGYVMQDEKLFSGSIAENISFFDTEATIERIEVAARKAALHEDIAAMPMGYHTLVGDMGSTLSGGQQQRLQLARALYREPRMLILDEATSSLDLDCEGRIVEAIKALSITRIVIAHRPETIANADRILVLVNGALREMTRVENRPQEVDAVADAAEHRQSQGENDESVA